ncbi:hypothetical protein AABB24_036239 [Solanum stoloniferum]|uniref:Endonuclease/exonuclease/phosphatase domain-containing protein n=1 Tax=Solanum stoloniferum TaxID=62892 RepID=A0ABD2RB59_9SOLN
MLVTWNVRGFNQEVKHKEMRLFLRNKVNMIAICEHRVREDRVSSIINKIMPSWEWYTNSANNVRGSIWVVWNPGVINFTTVENFAQHIHGQVEMQGSKMKFQFTAVYDLHSITARIPLWTTIHQLSTHIPDPWLIMGDFNSILTTEDRPIGSQVQSSETRDFQECITDCNLTELATVGRKFTWTNGHVFSRIDRAPVNAEWVLHMPIVQVSVIDPLFSNHSLLRINVEEHRDAKKRPFNFSTV